MSVNDRYTSIMNDRTNEINSRLLPRISLEAQANQLPHQQRYLSPSQTTLSHTDHAAPDHFNYQQPQTTVQQQQQQQQQQQPYSYDTPQPYSYAQYPSTRVDARDGHARWHRARPVCNRGKHPAPTVPHNCVQLGLLQHAAANKHLEYHMH